MSEQYNKLKQAKFLYALFKSMKGQITEKIDPNKTYTVEIKGNFILALLSTAQRQFRETRNLQKFLRGGH